MILLTSTLPINTAWAKSPAKQESRRDQKEQVDLGERAEIYWRSVRWADPQSASVFIENPDDRVVFQQWLKDQGRDQKLTEAKVLNLQVSKEIRKPQDGRIRTAAVIVSVEGYKLPGQVLKQQTVTQRWYRSEAGWFVDWSPPPPPKP